MRIAAKHIEKIKASKELKNILAMEFNISPHTLYIWLKENSPLLTIADNLVILSKVLSVPQDKLMVETQLKSTKK